MRAFTAGWILLAAAWPLVPAHAQQRIAPETWLKASDYPAAAGRDGETFVNLSYAITPEGRIAKCRVGYKNAPKAIANATCALLSERARYVPRFDESGKAVEWRDQLTVSWSDGTLVVPFGSDFGGAVPVGNPSNWMTDDDYPKAMPRSGALSIAMTFEIGPEGRIVACSFETPMSHAAVGNYTCRLFAARARFEMPRGLRGEPLATRGRGTMHWRRPG